MWDFSKRGAIRLLCFGMAALAVLLGFVARLWQERNAYQRQLDIYCQRSLQDAADLMDSISLSLDKQLHAGQGEEADLLPALLSRQAGEAKAALSVLPAGQAQLSGAYHFLSQVGDYALRASRGQPEDYQQTLIRLRDYARALTEELQSLQNRAAFGQLSLTGLPGEAGAGRQAEDFDAIEEHFSGYPTLIYDGPFSDHLLDRSPRLTAGRPSLSRESAREVAAACALCRTEELTDGENEHSRLPLYTFKAGEKVVGVTREGGFPCYMVDGREIDGIQAVSEEAARETALRYLAYLGLSSLKETYYETANNILTINYAHFQQGTLCYPDLIKVGVAFDTGRVVFFDARGYIMNHHPRTLAEPVLSKQQAEERLGPLLKALSVRPALIPTAGGGEALCYEFSCSGEGGEHYLSYIDVETGEQRQLLKLVQTGGGVLTR